MRPAVALQARPSDHGPRRSARPSRQDPGRQERRVVDADNPRRRRGHAPGEPRCPLDEIGGPHEPFRRRVSHPAKRRRPTAPHDRERHDRHPGHLRHGHQRDRGEVEDQPGEGHAREHHGTDWQEHGFGPNRCAQQGHAGCDDPWPAAGVILLRPFRPRPPRQREDADGGPEREKEAGVGERERPGHEQESGGERQDVGGRPAVIDGAPREEQDSGQRRALDRPAAANDVGVPHQAGNRRQHGARAQDAADPKGHQRQADQYGDVPAGDRDDVVGPRLLQSSLHGFVQTRAIADDDGPDDGGGARAPASDVAGQGAPDECPDLGRALGERRPSGPDLDEHAALDRSDQCGAPACERALAVLSPLVAITRGTAKLHGKDDGAPRAPRAVQFGAARRVRKAYALRSSTQGAADGDQGAAADLEPVGEQCVSERAHVEAERDAVRPW